MRYPFFILLFFFFSTCALSQSSQQAIDAGQDVNVMFRNEATGGIFAHSRGFGANFRRFWHKTGKLKTLIEIEATNMKSPKETTIKSYEGGKSYKYGKLYGLLFVRAGFGIQRSLYERAERKSIEVRMIYNVGALLCFAKPIYLQIAYPDPNNPGSYITKDEAYDPTIHNQNNIIGGASFFEGLQSLKLRAGLYSKLGFSFEFGRRVNLIKCIETGVILDFLPDTIQEMAYNKAEMFYVTPYVAFIFGKRWF
ncbi:MAG: hypothetical protein JST67_06580 [Bacteroidetes bacterium]|nr:hypothetical protein [Bacteroidota bacterium]